MTSTPLVVSDHIQEDHIIRYNINDCIYVTLFNKVGLLLHGSQHSAMGRLSTSVEPSTRCAECGSVEDADLTCSNCKSVPRHKESKTQKVVSIELLVIFKVVNI